MPKPHPITVFRRARRAIVRYMRARAYAPRGVTVPYLSNDPLDVTFDRLAHAADVCGKPRLAAMLRRHAVLYRLATKIL